MTNEHLKGKTLRFDLNQRWHSDGSAVTTILEMRTLFNTLEYYLSVNYRRCGTGSVSSMMEATCQWVWSGGGRTEFKEENGHFGVKQKLEAVLLFFFCDNKGCDGGTKNSSHPTHSLTNHLSHSFLCQAASHLDRRHHANPFAYSEGCTTWKTINQLVFTNLDKETPVWRMAKEQ